MSLSSVRCSRLLLLLIPILLLSVPLVVHQFFLQDLSARARSPPDAGGLDELAAAELARKTLGLSGQSWDQLSGPALERRIQDLLRIKHSVQNELQTLESQRSEMQLQISAFHRKIEELRAEATRHQNDLERLRLSIEQAHVALTEFQQRNTPEIHSPWPLSVRTGPPLALPALAGVCTLASCFNFAPCGVSVEMRVFIYQWEQLRNLMPDELRVTASPARACLLVAVVDEFDLERLRRLPHWGEDGRNHLILVRSGPPVPVHDSRAMVGSAAFGLAAFRREFDLVLPHLPDWERLAEPWRETPALLPIHKKYLISYQGHHPNGTLSGEGRALLGALEQIGRDQTDDRVWLELNCPLESSHPQLCHSREARNDILLSSTFALIPFWTSDAFAHLSSASLQMRLFEALKASSIPVIIGHPASELLVPFSEHLTSRDFVVHLPMARMGELHYWLRSIPDADLFHMKRKGNLVWRNYLASQSHVIRTALNVVRDRLQIPPPPTKDTPSPTVFNEDSPRTIMETLPPEMEPSEPLGPLEQPRPSVPYRRNISAQLIDAGSRWNEHFDPFFLPPYVPWEPLLPTDAKFLGSSLGFRPIGGGTGGAGKEFSQALGGNRPSEQFTVVMLTYERELVLIDALVRLYGLPFLNKVVVVWNSPQGPSGDLQWPDIGVPIEVIRTTVNSLNNRFIPFDVIETEAILSVDDDAHLRHDEIIFGFRVWRENRDQLVGFPGRYHAWDLDHNSWNYNSNYSCELSMVLTGAAFYHKYYNYLYSAVMPQAIREKVDEFMNCEDLAMNFLISHVTRKPPVKVTSRWTFRCPGCPVSLSEDDTHFQERHLCINFFNQVYGYMPLLFTQYRADSVLFKTRISADKQKCFKFI